jgi:hypothetical protein
MWWEDSLKWKNSGRYLLIVVLFVAIRGAAAMGG